MKIHPRWLYASVFAGLFLVEVCIALFVHDSFIRPYVGDLLVTVLLCCFARIFVPKKLPTLPLWIFLFAAAVEAAQYFDIVRLLGLEGSPVLSTVIGRTFSFADLICYALGCAAFFLAERFFTNKRKLR